MKQGTANLAEDNCFIHKALRPVGKARRQIAAVPSSNSRPEHCQLRLGGNPELTRIITYTYLHNQTAIHSYNNHTPTHQTLVGVEQHCQLRLGGHPKLTRIITYTYLHNQMAFTITQQTIHQHIKIR